MTKPKKKDLSTGTPRTDLAWDEMADLPPAKRDLERRSVNELFAWCFYYGGADPDAGIALDGPVRPYYNPHKGMEALGIYFIHLIQDRRKLTAEDRQRLMLGFLTDLQRASFEAR
jgi:hypothetical protein